MSIKDKPTPLTPKSLANHSGINPSTSGRDIDEKVRLDAWEKIWHLLKSGIISEDEIKEKKIYYLQLLESKDLIIRHYTWKKYNTL